MNRDRNNAPLTPATALGDRPHRRRNMLTGEYVLVSPHRIERPWQGQSEAAPATSPPYEPDCYLCPGNVRANGQHNPKYSGTFVFENDFAALLPDTSSPSPSSSSLLQAEPVAGKCRVICFSPRHDLSLPEMSEDDVAGVVDTWAEQVGELRQNWRWVQVFENKGAVMGCSNPHPHGQIWALSGLPNEAAKEDATQRAHWRSRQRHLLLDYLDEELASGERLVLSNDDWAVVTPFWAAWPYETLLLPRRAVRHLDQLTGAERRSLAAILRRLLIRYDNLFQTSFPYSMGWHGAPGNVGAAEGVEHWQLHAHFYPPLLRSASVKKFMVGFEMLAEAQRDLTPEQAAARLGELPDTHYRHA